MPQFLLLLDGMTGAGKTTTTEILSEQLKRTAVFGMDKIKWFISDFERGMRDNGIARDVVLSMTEKYLDHGLSVIVDQPYWTADHVTPYENLAQERGIKLHKFQLIADPETAFKRVLKRQADRTRKIPEDRIRRNIQVYQESQLPGFTVIDTTALPPDEPAKEILVSIA